MKKKQKTYSQLIKVYDDIYSVYIRRKESDSNGMVSCVTCGIIRHWKDRMTCGHYLSRTKTKIRWDDRNCHPQCAKCNWLQKLTGDCTNYTIWLIEHLGYAVIQDLNEIKNSKVKLTRSDLQDKIDYYQHKIDSLK